MLGGEEEVLGRVADTNVKNIRFRFNKRDPLRQGLMGRRQAVAGLVLRVRRRKGLTSESTTGTVSMESMGVVKSIYTFKESADYQFLPQTTLVSLRDELALNSGVLECIPRPFQNEHFDGREVKIFVDKTANQHLLNEQWKERREGRKAADDSDKASMRKWGDPIPTAVHLKAVKRRGNSERYVSFKDKLTELFARRPIWSKRSIETTGFFRGGEYLLGQLLPEVAYHFGSGPFKGLWIRYGYDPAQHPESRYLQVLSCRVSKRDLLNYTNKAEKRLANRLGGKTRVNLNTLTVWDLTSVKGAKKGTCFFMFNEDLQSQFTFQLCDMMCTPLLEKFSAGVPYLPRCDAITGWFSDETTQTLRIIVSDYYSSRQQLFECCSLDYQAAACMSLPSYTGGAKVIATAAAPHTTPAFQPPSNRPDWLACDAPPIDHGGECDWYECMRAFPDLVVNTADAEATYARSAAKVKAKETFEKKKRGEAVQGIAPASEHVRTVQRGPRRVYDDIVTEIPSATSIVGDSRPAPELSQLEGVTGFAVMDEDSFDDMDEDEEG